jgi:hypothetical protein
VPLGIFESSFKVGVSKLVPNEKKTLSLELSEYERPKEGLSLSSFTKSECIPILLMSYLTPYLRRSPEEYDA